MTMVDWLDSRFILWNTGIYLFLKTTLETCFVHLVRLPESTNIFSTEKIVNLINAFTGLGEEFLGNLSDLLPLQPTPLYESM